MLRSLTLAAALLLGGATVSSSSGAAATDSIRFSLDTSRRAGELQLELRSTGLDHNSHVSNNVPASELIGLDAGALRASAGRPISFTLQREAGRIECRGQGGEGSAVGRCSFAPDPGFGPYLVSRGIANPSFDQSYALAVLGVSRSLVDALHAANYRPSIDTLSGLAALDVDADYIRDIAARGYHPDDVDDLLAFRALGVTPDYIDGLGRAGYGRLDADQIVQFKAMGINPDYVRNIASAGYRGISADDLVQLKALGVTGDYLQGLRRAGYDGLEVSEVVQLKAMGVTPDYIEQLRRSGVARLSPSQLVHYRALGIDR